MQAGLPAPPGAGAAGEAGAEATLDGLSVPTTVSSRKKLQPSITIADNPAEVFTIGFSPDGRYLATGIGDGSLRVFAVQTGKVAFELQAGNAAALPATCLRFRPATAATRTKNVLVAANAVGSIQHWHVTSGKCLHTIEEKDNQIFALDYRPDGLMFATGGKDATVRVYDESTKTCTMSLKGAPGYGANVPAGHSNRIFSIKWHNTDENLLMSGGWDNTIQIWDTRLQKSVRSIFGPHLAGDSLDMAVDSAGKATILTGSWRPEGPLEMWDFESGALEEQIEWKDSLIQNQPCMLYAAQFSKASVSETSSAARYVAAGGSGANETRIFDRLAGSGQTALVGTVAGLNRGVFCVDWSPVQDKIAIGGGDGTIRILDVVDRTDDEGGMSNFDRHILVHDTTTETAGSGGAEEAASAPAEEKADEATGP
mmetsp:Transcript_12401/g.29104  ORF Transcript_12401/g.29104 Transcript_12401/m.29104 type:complete len:426 (+) Transcript_12401:80-1357(+)